MPFNPHENPGDLKALQDDIYRERILRARKMTPEERLADVFELTNFVFELMLDGAMSQKNIEDRETGWEVVRQRLKRLGKVRDEGRFVLSREGAHP